MMDDEEFDYTDYDYDPLKAALESEEEVFYLVPASSYPGHDDLWQSAINPATPIDDKSRKQLLQALYLSKRDDYLERKIKAIFDMIVADGRVAPTDERIAAHLPIGPKGMAYTRETVNRKRNAMRRRGIAV